MATKNKNNNLPQLKLKFKCVSFGSLKRMELYEVLALRQEVFCVEQNCPYQDLDGKDIHARHLLIRDESGKLVAYARLLPKGVSYPEYSSIGRVVSSPTVRGQGVGQILMTQSIRLMTQYYPNDDVKIGAQSYLLKFYGSFGFEAVGEEYLEDGIPHISMILKS